MASITFLWHLHQPAYRTADGRAHAPWVAVHAGGAYLTLARSLLETGAAGHVINLVPTLVEQMEAYAEGRVDDPVLDLLCRPAPELAPRESSELLRWAFNVTPRQMSRFVRLAELESRRRAVASSEALGNWFGPGDLRDLQVLFVLAQAGEQAWRDPELADLANKGGQFSSGDHETVVAWLRAQPARILALWRELAGQDGVEISTSPYAHPILPLLVDTAIVRESWAPAPPPEAPEFRRPDDAVLQLERGLGFMRDRGYEVHGCWPPEGSVSEDVLRIYGEAGVRWLVTDEGILERSLERSLRKDGRLPAEIYAPWRLGEGPLLFFRDRELSDRIGFVYGRWQRENEAAADLVAAMEGVARTLPAEAAIVLALDGENPWLHYPEGGGVFLRTLVEGIAASGELEPVTLAQLVERTAPRSLDHLHPGSWIGQTFATWIGHPEKSRAWELLASVRGSLPEDRPVPEPMLLAEGSDWFWWLGDDNPSALAPLYDRIFRRHLEDACAAAGVPAPEAVKRPLKVPVVPIEVPISRNWARPVFDGRLTSYFEWSLAAFAQGGGQGTLRRVGLWADGRWLYVLVEASAPLTGLTEDRPFHLELELPSGTVESLTYFGGQADRSDRPCAVGRVAEAALPWDGSPGARLHVQLGEETLPVEAALLLEPLPVDEEPPEDTT
ncbi:MAG TPA: hypothetical protein ENK19_03090 [Acidobacteria bacterium]|nr:hypothetical protein [Acidobacteriota bacterium]